MTTQEEFSNWLADLTSDKPEEPRTMIWNGFLWKMKDGQLHVTPSGEQPWRIATDEERRRYIQHFNAFKNHGADNST